MAMSIGANDDSGPISDMNTTPLVDVMLVLLILFIITLPVMTNSTNLHIGRHRHRGPRAAISLEIDFDGTILWNGTSSKTWCSWSAISGRSRQGGPAELHVQPDRRAKYDTVAQVLAIAQRSGMQRIGFAGQERFLE